MSLITRCPACATMFKVVPDQLRVSAGWVRCGRCAEVFDANAELMQAPPAVAVRPPDAPVNKSTPAPISRSVSTSSPIAQSKSEVSDVPAPERIRPARPQPAVRPSVKEAPAPKPPVARKVEPENPEPVQVDDVVSRFAPRDAEEADDSEVPSEAFEHSFLKSSRPASAWHSRTVRWLLGVVGVLSLAALLFQVAVHERDRIAAYHPATKPWLVRMCHWMGCDVGPLHQVDAVVIDSSAFTFIRTDVYRLNFTLKNTGLVAVATPAVELTLTDLGDQPVVRKVFGISEFGPEASSTLAPGTELVVSLSLGLKLPVTSERVAGYRLLSFYP
jgi:predicted Zn finger-like uncharacterized protein